MHILRFLVPILLVAAACGDDDEAGTVTADPAETCVLEAASADHEDADDADGHEESDSHEDDASDSHEDDDHTADLVPEFVVDIDMFEFGYSCDLPTLDAGTVLELRFTNIGAVEHEAVIGDMDAQDEAAEAMAEGDDGHDDGHGDGHDVPSITLDSGESGSLVVAFPDAGDLIVGCHIPGHWDSGMRSNFSVGA